MVRHIVMFRFREDVKAEQRKTAYTAFYNGIMALKNIIPEIRKIEVGYNINSAEDWDICLCGEFDNLADVNTYSSHPAHVKVASALKALLAGRSCVDYKTAEE